MEFEEAMKIRADVQAERVAEVLLAERRAALERLDSEHHQRIREERDTQFKAVMERLDEIEQKIDDLLSASSYAALPVYDEYPGGGEWWD